MLAEKTREIESKSISTQNKINKNLFKKTISRFFFQNFTGPKRRGEGVADIIVYHHIRTWSWTPLALNPWAGSL